MECAPKFEYLLCRVCIICTVGPGPGSMMGRGWQMAAAREGCVNPAAFHPEAVDITIPMPMHLHIFFALGSMMRSGNF